MSKMTRLSRATYDPGAPAYRRARNDWLNQVQRAKSEMHLSLAPFTTRDRMLILNLALEEAIEDHKREEEDRRNQL